MNIEQLDKEISLLEEEILTTKGTETEVYTRIVGYHRAVTNWNKGKREEYNHRLCFDVNKSMSEANLDKRLATASTITTKENPPKATNAAGLPVRYYYFYGEHCKNCLPVKEMLADFPIEGESIDVGTDLGLGVAKEYNVTATPTVVLFDVHDKVTGKLLNLKDVEDFLSPVDKLSSATA